MCRWQTSVNHKVCACTRVRHVLVLLTHRETQLQHPPAVFCHGCEHLSRTFLHSGSEAKEGSGGGNHVRLQCHPDCPGAHSLADSCMAVGAALQNACIANYVIHRHLVTCHDHRSRLLTCDSLQNRNTAPQCTGLLQPSAVLICMGKIAIL